ncbi:MAG: hypothetical protein WA160_03440 [Pseudobdellovibrio sp.]
MSQVKKFKINKVILAMTTLVVVLTSFSCAKKASGIRTPLKKTESTNLNQVISTQTEQLAASQNILYKIATLETPEVADDGSASVKFELLTPDLQYLPVATSHQNGQLDSQGTYQDAARSVQVLVQARCSADSCSKYILLITVSKNSKPVYQTAALSYSSDIKFNLISTNQTQGFFAGLDQLENYVRNVAPKNDRPASNEE